MYKIISFLLSEIILLILSSNSLFTFLLHLCITSRAFTRDSIYDVCLFLGCSSWFETIKYFICKWITISRGSENLWFWICQAAESREWSFNDPMLHSKFCCPRGFKKTGIWCCLWYLVVGCVTIYYVSRVSLKGLIIWQHNLGNCNHNNLQIPN